MFLDLQHRLLATQAKEQKLIGQEICFEEPYPKELVCRSPTPLFEFRWFEVLPHGGQIEDPSLDTLAAP
jgi:hypothetical protein